MVALSQVKTRPPEKSISPADTWSSEMWVTGSSYTASSSLVMLSSVTGVLGSLASSVRVMGIPLSRCTPPTVVRPRSGRAGAKTTSSLPYSSSTALISAATLPRRVESTFFITRPKAVRSTPFRPARTAAAASSGPSALDSVSRTKEPSEAIKSLEKTTLVGTPRRFSCTPVSLAPVKSSATIRYRFNGVPSYVV